MTITLTSKEFDEAVSLWLKAQGFTTDRYSISTRVIAGRSDGPLGTRLEVQLDQLDTPDLFAAMKIGEIKPMPSVVQTTLPKYEEVPISLPKRFGQGHADE